MLATVSANITALGVLLALLIVLAAVGLDVVVGKIEWVGATTLFFVALIFFGLFTDFGR